MDDNSLNEFPFEFRKKQVDESLQKENWKAIDAGIMQEEKPVVKLRWLRPVMIAASVLVVFAGIWYWQSNSGNSQVDKIKTFYGELRRITLPDGSTVVVNSNSTISIPQNWPEQGDRQLWLDGEAYFEITKKPITKQRFIVHTSHIDIEVLGTKFNVNTRHEQSIVSLEEGKVQLSVDGNNKELIEAKQPVVMKPGEVAIINGSHKVAINEDRTVTYRSGWSRNEYHFDNTSLSEIAKMIKDNYGYTMQTDDNSLYQRKISGDLRAASLQEFIQVLEVAFKIKMNIENKTIHLQAI